MSTETNDWIVFDLIGVLAAPPWHDIPTRATWNARSND